jgi:2-hydroxy-6-oxonona-2,4-dienedioate hydrolase
MDAVGIEKAHLYGGSPGAPQVIRLALDHPDRVVKLILQSATGVRPSYFTPAPWEGARLTQVVARDPTYENVVAQVEAMVPRADRRTEEFIMNRFLAASDRETNDARARVTGPQDGYINELENITQPTLVIWGLNERDVPLDHGLRLAVSIPNARFHIYGNETGHFPQFERAKEFNRLVTTFLLE